MSDEKHGEGFTFTDKRRVDEQGELRSENAETKPAPEAAPEIPETGAAEREAMRQTADRQASQQDGALPSIDFQTFSYSLATQALALIGAVRIPGQPEFPVDLPAAKQIIDILAMLEEKTKGNLSENEARLLGTLLYDLRLHYVQASRAKSGASPS